MAKTIRVRRPLGSRAKLRETAPEEGRPGGGYNRTMLGLTFVCAVAAIGSLGYAWWVQSRPQPPDADFLAEHETRFRASYRDRRLDPDELRALDDHVRSEDVLAAPVADFRQSLRRRIELAGEANRRGLALVRRDEMALAREEFRSATRHDPDGFDGWSNLASAALATGDDRDLALAREAFDNAIRLEPESWLTRYNHAHLFVRTRQLDEALAALEEAARIVEEAGRADSGDRGGSNGATRREPILPSHLESARQDFRQRLDLEEFRGRPEFERVRRVFGGDGGR